MCAEKKQLEILSVWKVVKLARDKRILSGKWVFKLKLNASGEPARFKARWVARGFLHEGVDYHESIAGNGRCETLRVLLVVILLLRLHTVHIDGLFDRCTEGAALYQIPTWIRESGSWPSLPSSTQLIWPQAIHV
jgi:hypothetical protein